MTLNRLRRAKGWSPRRLAFAAGVDPATVYRIELGFVEPREDTKLKIATALGEDVFTLWP